MEELEPAGVEWALDRFDRWLAAGRGGIALAESERWAVALLLLALEDHLISPGARAAVVTTDQPLLLARSLRVVSDDVQVCGLSHVLRDGAVTVYRLGADILRPQREAIAAEAAGPILLAFLGSRGTRWHQAAHALVGPYQARIAIHYPGPLPHSTRQLLTPMFGDPLPGGMLQAPALVRPGSDREEMPYPTPRHRELAALFGDAWHQLSLDSGEQLP